ncbi:MAG TPA: response regulator [Candidatus Mediterraneibacter cottocaccae]|nr:response regulator [Candidatus Mediterraneibacter cottocaccae]
MHTVLIVDDEKIERKGIRSLVEREDSDCRIMEAENGREAAELLEEENVDILLTDIRMPHMNGMELAERAAGCSGSTQTIIFSGLQDFEYARTAIEYGVKDYILKPVDPAEFSRAYGRVRRNIRRREENHRSREQKSKFLNQYFLIRFIAEDKPAVAEKAGVHIDLDEWDNVRWAMSVECGDRFFEENEEEFGRVVTEVFGEQVYNLNMNMTQSLLLIRRELDSPRKTAEKFMTCLHQAFYREFYIAVSGRIGSWQDIPGAYRKLDGLMEEKFYQTGRHIFCEKPEGAGGEAIEEGQIMGMLEKDIRNRDMYHLEEHFERVIKEYSEDRKFPSMYIKFVFSNIVKIVWESSAIMKGGDFDKVIDQIYGCQTIEEVVQITKEQMDEYLQFINQDKGSYRFKAEVTKDYVKHHYGEDINLDVLAKRLFLSSGYLSMIFKKETGENLNQFIKNVRLEKSAELLTGTDLPVGEVCRQVGFGNMSYFSKCFRRQYGLTPDAYRKQGAEERKA